MTTHPSASPSRSEPGLSARRIVVNMVAHNGEPHLAEALESITRQTRVVDAVVVYDDASTDRTMEIVESFRDRLPIEVRELPDCGYTEFDAVYTRVGQQVSMGLRDLSDNDVIIMTDLDDVWEDTRVEHQVGVFDSDPSVLVVAGSGPCIDEHGDDLGIAFHDLYPRPSRWRDRDAVDQLRWTIWRPYGSGANMALRGGAATRIPPVPYGWLCDRWVTLAAAAMGGLLLDDTPVVKYRLHEGNTLGANGSGFRGLVDRHARWIRAPFRGLGRLRDLNSLRSVATTPELRRALAYPRLVLTLASPTKWLGR